MYLNPHEAMQLLEITTRQGLHKIVKNHNISFKSQGAGKPNLYLKNDLENYKINNAKNIKSKKTKTVIKKAEKIKTDIKKRKIKNQELKEEVKKQVDTEISKDLNINDFKEQKEKERKKDLDLPNDDEIENPLNKVGMAEYERVTELLKEQGTYKDLDRALVLAYAISYQKYIFSTIASGKQDDTTMNDFGDLKVHPYFQVAKESFSQMEKIAKLLGIGARSRVGLELTKPKKKNFADIIAGKSEFE